MALVKFPLVMADEFKCYTIEQLKEHFDIGCVVRYFYDGKLLRWLKARNYAESAQVEKLSRLDRDLAEKLCKIFDVPIKHPKPLSPETVEILNRLKQYTSDKKLLAQVEQELEDKTAHVSFTQAKFDEHVKNFDKIYLVQDEFVIPLDRPNKTYIGIGDKARAVIESDKPVDLERLKIKFESIRIEGDNWIYSSNELAEIERLVNSNTAKTQYMEKMRRLKEKLISTKNAQALRKLGDLYKKIPEFIMAEDCYREADLIDNSPAQEPEPTTPSVSVPELVEFLTAFKEIEKSISRGYIPTKQMATLQQRLEDEKDITMLRKLAILYDKGKSLVFANDEVTLMEHAKACRKIADQIEKTNAEKLYDEGCIAYQERNYTFALEKLKKSYELGCNLAAYKVALIYERTGNYHEAKRWYTRQQRTVSEEIDTEKNNTTNQAIPKKIVKEIDDSLLRPHKGTDHIEKNIDKLVKIAQERRSSLIMKLASNYYQRIGKYNKAEECYRKGESFRK